MVLFIGFGQVSVKIIYPIINGLISFANMLIFKSTSPGYGNNNYSKNRIIDEMYKSVGCILVIIPFAIARILQREEREKENLKKKRNTSLDLIYNDPLKKLRHVKLRYFIAIGLFSFLNIYAYYYTSNIEDYFHDVCFVTLQNLPIALFTIFIFNYPLYSHRLLGLIIYTVSFIISISARCNYPPDNKVCYVRGLIANIIGRISNCVVIIIARWMLYYKYFSPYILSFLYGLIKLSYLLIWVIIDSIYKKHDWKKFLKGFYCYKLKTKNCGESDKKIVFKVLLFIILSGAETLFLFLTLKNLDASYYMVSLILSVGAFLLVRFIVGGLSNNKFIDYLNIFLFIIVILALLVYLEIIELRFCGLNLFTDKSIKLREKNECRSLLSDKINDSLFIEETYDETFD